jgi:hypothetical protein
VTFFCNFTNTSGSQIYAATPTLILDGVSYDMSFNTTTGVYYYVNNNTWYSGIHTAQCSISKADYSTATNTTNVSMDNFAIFLASNKSSVKLSCPFPTISSITPAGQRAGVGMFRIVNYNLTSLKNYSITLNNTPPTGVYIYARSGSFVSGASRSGWTLLDTISAPFLIKNLNASNTSAYIWLVMDCINAPVGTTDPFNFIIAEAG